MIKSVRRTQQKQNKKIKSKTFKYSRLQHSIQSGTGNYQKMNGLPADDKRHRFRLPSLGTTIAITAARLCNALFKTIFNELTGVVAIVLRWPVYT